MAEPVKLDKLGQGKELICMVGLPYSGKSTEAKTLGHPIVCPDAVRAAIHGERFITKMEELVWFIVKRMVLSLFLAGHDKVILDATSSRVRFPYTSQIKKKARVKWI